MEAIRPQPETITRPERTRPIEVLPERAATAGAAVIELHGNNTRRHKSAPRQRSARPQQPDCARKLDQPFVDMEVAMEAHPDVFEASFCNVTPKKAGSDRPLLRVMVKAHDGDPEITARLFREFGRGPGVKEHKPAVTGDIFDDFVNKTKRYRALTIEEEIKLARNMKIGTAATKKMLYSGAYDDPVLKGLACEGAYSFQAFYHANLRLGVKPARRLAAAFPHESKIDVLQYGFIGVQEAIEMFDETKGFTFSTYAMTSIVNAMQRGLVKGGRQIRIPDHKDREKRKIERTEEILTRMLGREPSYQEVSDATGIDIMEIVYLKVVGANHTTSLNKQVNRGGDAGTNKTELGELIPAEDPIVESNRESERKAEIHATYLNVPTLTTDDKILLSFRYGIVFEELRDVRVGQAEHDYLDAIGLLPDDDEKLTYARAGKILGVNETTFISRLAIVEKKIRDYRRQQDLGRVLKSLKTFYALQ